MYHQLITEFTGVTDRDSLQEIEGLMRQSNGGVLDHLDSGRFRAEALLSHQVSLELARAIG